jgi:hypothetical protein
VKVDPRPVLFLAVGLPPFLTGALVLPFCAPEARPWVLATAAAVGFVSATLTLLVVGWLLRDLRLRLHRLAAAGESLAGHAQILRLNFQPTSRRSDAGVN